MPAEAGVGDAPAERREVHHRLAGDDHPQACAGVVVEPRQRLDQHVEALVGAHLAEGDEGERVRPAARSRGGQVAAERTVRDDGDALRGDPERGEPVAAGGGVHDQPVGGGEGQAEAAGLERRGSGCR